MIFISFVLKINSEVEDNPLLIFYHIYQQKKIGWNTKHRLTLKNVLFARHTFSYLISFIILSIVVSRLRLIRLK